MRVIDGLPGTLARQRAGEVRGIAITRGGEVEKVYLPGGGPNCGEE